MSIPKVIHYCWFGGSPLPKLAQKCIKSWKKYCPDYEIIEWNESNFDINSNQYVKEAYEAKKWAFVSDYARFEILYKCGGIYLDTDVEMIKPIDNIVSKGPFMGCETDGKSEGTSLQNRDEYSITVAPGLIIAAEPNMEFLKKIMDDYKKDHFSDKGHIYNVVSRTTDMLINNGLKDISGIQFVAGFYIYPTEYFCPKTFATGEIKKSKNTVCIHHYAASWHDQKEREYWENRRKEYRLKYAPRIFLMRLLGDEMYNRLKNIYRKPHR